MASSPTYTPFKEIVTMVQVVTFGKMLVQHFLPYFIKNVLIYGSMGFIFHHLIGNHNAQVL